jgi:hypothetical protein
MRGTAPAFLVLVLVLVLGAAPAFGQPICLDGDADADTICDGVDNCPADSNTDQSDVDDDGAGDVCDPVDGGMLQPRVSLKALTFTIRGQAKAYVQTTPPTATLDLSDGVSVTMRDGGTTVIPVSWSAADCVSIRGTTRCTSPDREFRLVMKPKTSVLGLFRFRARAKYAAGSASFPGPGTVELTLGDVTYQGVATLCTVKARSLSCRYPPP